MEKGTVEIPDVSDLLEIDTMLAERIESWTKEWWEQRLQKGREEGKEEGLYLGELQTLQRQLTKRFGPLPEAVQVRLSTATGKRSSAGSIGCSTRKRSMRSLSSATTLAVTR